MMPSISVRRSKSSSSHLKPRASDSSTSKPAYILAPIENTRSLPHFTSSVMPGRERQKSRRLRCEGARDLGDRAGRLDGVVRLGLRLGAAARGEREECEGRVDRFGEAERLRFMRERTARWWG